MGLIRELCLVLLKIIPKADVGLSKAKLSHYRVV